MCSEINNGSAIVFTDVIANLKELKCPNSLNDEEKDLWAKELTDLALTYAEVSSFSHKFDYSITSKYNGCRSYLKMVVTYFVHISICIEILKKRPNDNVNVRKLKTLQKQCKCFITMGNSMKRINDFSFDSNNQHIFTGLNYIEKSLESKILASKELNEESLCAFYNPKYFTLWLPEWFRSMIKKLMILTYFMKRPLKATLLGFLSTDSVGKCYTDFCLNCTVDIIQKPFNRITNSFIISTYLWISNLFNRSIECSFLTVDKRQKDYFINEKSKSIEKCNEEYLTNAVNGKGVQCLYMKPRNYSDKNLIIFVHGGGFITGSTKFYLDVFRSWIRETNSALLSIEYTLSPQVKYPVALQECLDVYLNCVSSDPVIGFNPKKIILAGDSAGGYFVTAMSIAIAEIRQLQISSSLQSTPLPTAVNAVYPVSSGCIGHLFPSRALIDMVLNPASPYMMLNAYSGPIDEEKELKENKTLWYKDMNKVQLSGSSVNQRVDDPFFHLTSYKNFDRLSSVELNIQVGEYDPILDDAIAIAKCWKGKVTLDIVPEMTHGFMSAELISPKTFTGCSIIRERLKEAFGQKVESNKKESKKKKILNNNNRISHNNNNNNNSFDVESLSE